MGQFRLKCHSKNTMKKGPESMEIENNLPKTFEPQAAQDKWYEEWLNKQTFKPKAGKQSSGTLPSSLFFDARI